MMAKWTRRTAYFVVPTSKPDKKYLRFRWGEMTYQFNCLRFGLSCNLWVFTKITRAVTAVLRGERVRFIVYINNVFEPLPFR